MKTWQKAALSALLFTSTFAQAETVNTVASFSVLGDIVKQIGGEHVNVTTLVDANSDPHTFEPSAKDSVTIKQSNVVFMSGLGLEGWMDRLIKASGYQGEAIVASNGIKTLKMEEDGEVITDPHAWNSAANVKVYAQNIIDALVKADPEDADYFKHNGAAYIAQLDALDQWAKSEFSQIDDAKRKVLTSHDAFGYFGDEYQVDFLSPVGFSTEAEASAKDVAKLTQQMKKEKISAYFIENQTDPRLVKQIAKAAGAQPGGELFPEALSDADGVASTYIDAFKHNVVSMLAAMK